MSKPGSFSSRLIPSGNSTCAADTGNLRPTSSSCVEHCCSAPRLVSSSAVMRRRALVAVAGSCTCLCSQPPLSPSPGCTMSLGLSQLWEEGSSNPYSTSSQNTHLKNVMPCIDNGVLAFQGVLQDRNPLSHPRWSAVTGEAQAPCSPSKCQINNRISSLVTEFYGDSKELGEHSNKQKASRPFQFFAIPLPLPLMGKGPDGSYCDVQDKDGSRRPDLLPWHWERCRRRLKGSPEYGLKVSPDHIFWQQVTLTEVALGQ